MNNAAPYYNYSTMKNIFSWLILLLYIFLIAVLWFNGKSPSVGDIPVLYLAGLVIAVVAILPGPNKQYGQVLRVVNLAFFILCLVHLFAVYGLLKTIFRA